MSYLDYIAGAVELLAIWVIGNKNKYGFVLGMICNILWVVYVLTTHKTYGLLSVVIPAFIINIRNFIKWNKPTILRDQNALKRLNLKTSQDTFIYCECGNELCSDGSFVSDTYRNNQNHVKYKCKKCGLISDYNFDIAPVPINWKNLHKGDF